MSTTYIKTIDPTAATRKKQETIFSHTSANYGYNKTDLKPSNYDFVQWLFKDCFGTDHFAAWDNGMIKTHYIGIRGDEFDNG